MTLVVVDATRLQRNLNLVLQVLEITDRVVVCLNLMDEAKRHGLRLDDRRLARDLGVPVVPTTARSGDGLLTTFTFSEQEDGSFVGTSAVGYAVVNYDFPFSIAAVPSGAEPGGKADATWRRVSEQAIIPGDTSGFELRRADW